MRDERKMEKELYLMIENVNFFNILKDKSVQIIQIERQQLHMRQNKGKKQSIMEHGRQHMIDELAYVKVVKSKATTQKWKSRMRLQDHVEKCNDTIINSEMEEEK